MGSMAIGRGEMADPLPPFGPGWGVSIYLSTPRTNFWQKNGLAQITTHLKSVRTQPPHSEPVMPSTSDKQRRFMAAAAHDPKFAERNKIPMSVAKDFNQADKGKKLADAMKRMK